MNNWQPIETAPRDWSWFLSYNADEGADGFSVVRLGPRGWEPDDWQPTHWMPLPDPPKVEALPEQPRIMSQLRASLQLNDTGE